MFSASVPEYSTSKECLKTDCSAGGFRSSGATTPIWLADKNFKGSDFTPLDRSLDCDVCVIGAGITGLSVANELAREGKFVVIIDDGDICSGETGRSSAHLGSGLDDRWFSLIAAHGLDRAKLIYQGHQYAIERIEALCKEGKIDCGFQRLSAFVVPHREKGHAEHEKAAEIIRKEIAALEQLGCIQFVVHPSAPIPGVDSGQCIEFANQAQFDPVKYCAGLARLLTSKFGDRVRIFTKTHANDVVRDATASFVSEGQSGLKVTTDSGAVIRCKSAVQATNIPFTNKLALVDRLEYYRTYCIGGRMKPGSEQKDKDKDRRDVLIWDTDEPYHYVRFTKSPDSNDEDVIIVGGEDHPAGHGPDGEGPFARLEEWTRKRWPGMADVAFKWSGHIFEPVDDIAFTGPNLGGPEGSFVHTGDSGNGLTHAVMAGRLLTDMILGKANPWASVFSTQRSIKDKTEYVKHMAEVQVGYKDWLKSGEISDIEELRPCTGAILKKGDGSQLQPLAVYKDETGKVYGLSAICPHMGGVVRWNSVEKTFDCPVHGSRFDKRGAVVTGPAHRGLSAVKIIGSE